MINKIFYSLVLFPNITYDTIIDGYKIYQIQENNFGEIFVSFFCGNKYIKILFTHIDFKQKNTLFETKNWKLTSDDYEFCNKIYTIIIESDLNDFNFFKSKDFYYEKPFGTVLNITSKCNLFCNYCFNDYDYPLDTRNLRKTLGLDDFKKIIDELYDAGTRDIILTGGEPFSCTFLWEILEYLRDKNIFTRINTNGTLLFDNILDKLNTKFSVHLMVSMHEFNNNDYFNINKAGALNIYGLENLKKWENKYEDKIIQLKKIDNLKNISIDFLTILTPKNILYLEDIYKYVLNNFKISDWHFFRLFATGTTKGISKEMITLAIHKLYKLNQKYSVGFKIVDAVPFCVTKNIYIASQVIDGELSKNHNVKTIITADGNVQIMSAFDMHLGNIFESGIKKIWTDKFVQDKLKNNYLPKECYDCIYKNECMGGSRMDANIYNGSYDALDPLCNLYNKKV